MIGHIFKVISLIVAFSFSIHSYADDKTTSNQITSRSEVFNGCGTNVALWEHAVESETVENVFVSNLYFQNTEILFNYGTSSSSGYITDYSAGHKNLPEVFLAAKEAFECQTQKDMIEETPSCQALDVDLITEALATCISDAFKGKGKASLIRKSLLATRR